MRHGRNGSERDSESVRVREWGRNFFTPPGAGGCPERAPPTNRRSRSRHFGEELEVCALGLVEPSRPHNWATTKGPPQI